jgi:hypothetical protein
VGISVKDAKIDPVRLVKSLSTAPRNRVRDNLLASSLPSERDQGLTKKDSSKKDHDPHKEAMEFELDISFNGRTYTATRTLPRIMQLRKDLISEIKNRRQLLRVRRLRWMKRGECTEKEVEDHDDEGTVQTVDEEDDASHFDVQIPELPDYLEVDERSQGGGSFAGRGFTLLHGLMRSYCPAIEGWLRSVTDLISPTDSPSLTNFLWEPVSSDSSTSLVRRLSSARSFSTLLAIEEDDWEDEDGDGESLGL